MNVSPVFKIELTQENIQDLKIFLGRVTLTGQEVPAFSEIMKSLYDANPIDDRIEE